MPWNRVQMSPNPWGGPSLYELSLTGFGGGGQPWWGRYSGDWSTRFGVPRPEGYGPHRYGLTGWFADRPETMARYYGLSGPLGSILQRAFPAFNPADYGIVNMPGGGVTKTYPEPPPNIEHPPPANPLPPSTWVGPATPFEPPPPNRGPDRITIPFPPTGGALLGGRSSMGTQVPIRASATMPRIPYSPWGDIGRFRRGF